MTHVTAINITGSTGSFSVLNSAYVNNLNLVWDINTGVNNKPVKITFTVNTEKNYDFLTIYSISESGTATQVFRVSGLNMSSTLSTIVPSGKSRVTFTTDGSSNYASNPLYSGIIVNYEVDYSTSTVSDLLINGYLRGNLTGGAVKIQTNFGDLQLGPQNEYYAHLNTNMNGFYFNKPVIIDSGEISSYAYSDLKLQTGLNTRMTILNNNGNVGIGTTSPSYKLDITGDIRLSNYSPMLCLQRNTSSGGFTQGVQTKLSDGTNHWYFGVLNNDWIVSKGNIESPKLTILENGKVGIGTSLIPGDFKLAVAGNIIAEEVVVKVQSNWWPDYVFHQDYRLKPLHEVEQFVKANKHLPGIPSAAQVEEKGLSMGEMQNKLLQKVEELTLYIIEQDKKIKLLEEKLK